MDSPVRPFTRAEGLRRGHTDKQLWGPRFQRLFQGVYLPAGEPVTVLQRARGALMVAPDGSYASHHTAAVLWGAVAARHDRDPHQRSRRRRDPVASAEGSRPTERTRPSPPYSIADCWSPSRPQSSRRWRRSLRTWSTLVVPG